MPLYEFDGWDGPPIERIGSGIGLGRLWVCKSRARKSFEATKTSLYCRFGALVPGWRRFQILCDDVTRVDSEVVLLTTTLSKQPNQVLIIVLTKCSAMST
jgi:hypothetical protein